MFPMTGGKERLKLLDSRDSGFWGGKKRGRKKEYGRRSVDGFVRAGVVVQQEAGHYALFFGTKYYPPARLARVSWPRHLFYSGPA